MVTDETQQPHPGDDRLNKLPRAQIVKREDFTDDLFLVWLETGVPFSFKAGQYITIGAGGLERPYSIASSPHETLIELFIEHILPEHGGHLTPLLWAQNVGDIVSMRPRAKGYITHGQGHYLVPTAPHCRKGILTKYHRSLPQRPDPVQRLP